MSLLSRTHPLDLTLVLGFLAANLIVGFWSRGGRQTFTEYAIGDKKFSTPVLTATIVATWMSGSLFFTMLENTYTRGLYHVLAFIIGAPAYLLFTGLVVGPRMGKFLNHVSVPDILGKYYGPIVQSMAGFTVLVSRVGYVAVQFKVISTTITILFGYTGPEITIIAATLVILYSASGGVKAVTFTDVVQFFTFGTLLPVLALAVWTHMGETAPVQVTAVLDSDPRFSFREVVRWTPDFRATLVLMGYLITPALPAQLFQRLAMARNVKQIKDSFTYAAILCLAIDLCLIWIALLILADKPGLEKQQLVPYIVQTYAYPGLKGLLGVGIIALAMSTADSTLNAIAVVTANDILPRFSSSYKATLGTARAATLGIGFVAMLLALQLQDLFRTILLFGGFSSSIVLVPIILTVFGFKTSRRVVLLAMSTGFVTVVSLLLKSGNENSFFMGQIANLVVLLGAHYLLGEKGGWGHNPLPKTDFIQIED